MLMDISSELIHSLLPLFMVGVLGTSLVTVGVIEGVAEATAAFAKVFSGALSDYLGLRQALGSLGAVIGPSLALLFMFWFANDIEAVMWVAVIPAFLTVALLLRYVQEPARAGDDRECARPPLRLGDMCRLGGAYWWVVGIGAVFTLARFTEAFLILRAEVVGVFLGLVPLALVVMNLFYALCAYPAGQAADRLDARRLLLLSLLLLILADLMLAGAGSPWLAFAGAALSGTAHGLQPRPPGQAGGRQRTAGTARYRLRPLQSAQRVGAVGGQRDCRCSLAAVWRCRDLPHRRSLRCAGRSGAVCLARSRQGDLN